MDRLDKHFRRLTKEAFARYGFAYAEVLTQWSGIVGDELGRVSMPEKVRWPRASGSGEHGRKGGGTMVVRVAQGRALEFQHLAPRIIERINSYYGYEAVVALKVLQGSVPEPAAQAEAAPGPESLPQAVSDRLGAIQDDHLRVALSRLGSAVSHRDGTP